jgi:hypothetical protein
LQEIINELATAYTEGEMWHERSANCWVYLGFRGLGRWHTHESCGDEDTRKCLSKYVIDNKRILPEISTDAIQRATSYKLTDRNQLESHLNQWIAREDRFIKQLKDSISQLSMAQEYTIYKMLCCYLSEVENERLYVWILLDNLKYNQWSAHHITQVMKELHKYFECDYKGGNVDFTIT